MPLRSDLHCCARPCGTILDRASSAASVGVCWVHLSQFTTGAAQPRADSTAAPQAVLAAKGERSRRPRQSQHRDHGLRTSMTDRFGDRFGGLRAANLALSLAPCIEEMQSNTAPRDLKDKLNQPTITPSNVTAARPESKPAAPAAADTASVRRHRRRRSIWSPLHRRCCRAGPVPATLTSAAPPPSHPPLTSRQRKKSASPRNQAEAESRAGETGIR